MSAATDDKYPRPDFHLKQAEREAFKAWNLFRKIQCKPPLDKIPEPPYCSFCGKQKSEAGALIEGVSAYTCVLCATKPLGF